MSQQIFNRSESFCGIAYTHPESYAVIAPAEEFKLFLPEHQLSVSVIQRIESGFHDLRCYQRADAARRSNRCDAGSAAHCSVRLSSEAYSSAVFN